MQNQVVVRTLIKKIRHPNYYNQNNIIYNDFTIGILDADVPSYISFAKILPPDYKNYINTGYGLPCVRFDQEEKALSGNADSLETIAWNAQAGNDHRASSKIPPKNSLRYDFYETIVTGDSGNPMFIIINGQPVILTVWTYGNAGAGSAIHKNKDVINTMMSQLSSAAGATSNYQLHEIVLTEFYKLPQQ